MNKYILGIVIPYYCNSIQAKKSAKKLIKSLYNQIKNNQDVLVIIAEDGQCSKWLNKYKLKNLEICFFKNNKGVSYARNTGINYLTRVVDCRYITFIDADDTISKDYISNIVRVCNEEDYDVIETRANINGVMVDKLPLDKYRNAVWGMIYKKEVIGDKRFEEDRQIAEDTDFNYRVIDFKKHIKGYCDTVYYYKYATNPKSLICRYNNKEIGTRR